MEIVLVILRITHFFDLGFCGKSWFISWLVESGLKGGCGWYLRVETGDGIIL